MQRNIRRGKKKKIIRAYKDQEQLATDKLFEISHYCEEKFQDESRMLVLDSHEQKEKNKDQAIETKIHNSLHSRQRLKIQQRQCNLKQYRTIQMSQIMEKVGHNKSRINNTVQNIFNTIESKQVFVGLKKQISHPKHTNPQSDNFLEFKPRRRIETMPISDKNIPLAIIKMATQYPKSQANVGAGRFSHKIKSLNSKKITNEALRVQRNLLFELDQGFRQKMRNNIFDFSERKIRLSFF